MTDVAIIGYASIDYPAVLDGFFKGDRTVMIRQRPADNFPRPGGCPLYVGRPLVSASGAVSIISWVGDDEAGELFRSWVANEGISTFGIATVSSGKTPVCFVIYQEDGSCCCCFDPGMMGRESLDDAQEQLIREAGLLCVTVGPPDIARRALGLIADDCRVAWVAKNDPLSYPIELRQELGVRADYIFCNRHEREWIDSALENRSKAPPLVVETGGGGPVLVEFEGTEHRVDVPTLEFDDASGAGDTLAGGCIKAILEEQSAPTAIAISGIAAASELLRQRSHRDRV